MRSIVLQSVFQAGFFIWQCAICPADVIPIMNPSFENTVLQNGGVVNSVDGWVVGVNGGGTWNINGSNFWSTPAPDGNQVGFAPNAQFGGPSWLVQGLNVSLLQGSIYTLEAYVGHPIGFATQYSIELHAGSNVLASTSGTGPAGSFQLISLTFDSSGSPFVGETLGIYLKSAGTQTAFDSVSLNVTSVPEPSVSTLGLCITGLIWLRRRHR